jgi:hypothetical protein
MHVQNSEKSSVLWWKVSWFRRFSLTFVMCALLAACSCSRIFLVFRYISTATDCEVKKWGHTVQLSNAESWIKQWTNRQKWRKRKKASTNRIYLLFC